MKNIFRLFTVMVAASTMMMFASCNKSDNPDTDGDSTTTEYTITVNCNDATLGTVSISPLQATYKAGDQVTITATPASTANFVSWNGTITENPYTFTVSGNATYTATFEAKPAASYNATFDGATLDISGYHEAIYADYTQAYNIYLFAFGAAREVASDGGVYLPYLSVMFDGTSTSNMEIYNGSVELYKDSVYETTDGDQYGDWQLYSTNNFNCTSFDLTDFTLSLTLSTTMYWLHDVIYEGAQTDGSDATHKNLALTLNNMPFELYSGKAMHKMHVVK